MKRILNPEDDHLTVFIILFLCLALMLGSVLAVRYRSLVGTLSPPNFAIVRGQIIESRMRAQSGKGGITYIPVVRYQYKVAGQVFDNDLISFRAEGGTQNKANLTLSRYRYQSQIRIYYDPNNPGFSVLNPERKTSKWDIAFVGVLLGVNVLLFFCILVVIYKRRLFAKSKREIRY